ncbi:hypothetical protein HMI54_013032 [Coelomomyces lativittatus]|nr:hypothetical protein HMI56_000929 [Coelomomyces lativittatus]KAJ1515008.1 hypothetical protein HMI54_013032 [Coelomomyces lativittatus]KAJ1518442.1 hypothetical protein HMI55_000001 [Coelomomyces lativittatus]
MPVSHVSINCFTVFLPTYLYFLLSKFHFFILDSSRTELQGASSADWAASKATLIGVKSLFNVPLLSLLQNRTYFFRIVQRFIDLRQSFKRNWESVICYLGLPFLIEPHRIDIVNQNFLQNQVLYLENYIHSLKMKLQEQQHRYVNLEELYRASHATRRKLEMEIEELRRKNT